jgi:hypothetical protein
MTLDELQADVPDLEKSAEGVTRALSEACSCETREDFASNLEDAEEAIKALLREIRSLRKKTLTGDEDA